MPQSSKSYPPLAERPRVLIAGHGGTLSDALSRKKWSALEKRMSVRVLTEHSDPSDPVVLAIPPCRARTLRGLGFYLRLPLHLLREIRHFRPDILIAQSPYESAVIECLRRITRVRVPLIVEIHGDWRTASRAYGSPWRRAVSPAADVVARFGIRSADAVRAVGPSMARLAEDVSGSPVDAIFPTFFDANAFFETQPRQLPARPSLLWVGTLQRYKNPDLLAAGWRIAAAAVPDASLVVVGSGPLQPVIDRLKTELPGRVTVHANLTSMDVRKCMDSATALVLPSLSEGLPRVGIEAFARGRPVIGTNAGGIPDLVYDEQNGLLVPPNDAHALGQAMIRMLTDSELAERLGHGAFETAAGYRSSPEQYAEALRELVASTIERARQVG